MAATVKAYGFNSTAPTATSVDSGDAASFKFGRDDTVISAATIQIPTATGTKFSYRKTLGLYVTAGGGSTNLSNRNVKLASSLATGLSVWWFAVTGYTQNTGTQGTVAGDYPADSGSNGATPANPADGTYAAMTTANQVYDSASVAATNTTKNGKYLVTVLGVDNTYAGGGGSATLPSLTFSYDES